MKIISLCKCPKQERNHECHASLKFWRSFEWLKEIKWPSRIQNCTVWRYSKSFSINILRVTLYQILNVSCDRCATCEYSFPEEQQRVQSCHPLYETWTRSKIHVSNLELTWIFDKVFDDFSTMVTQTNEEAMINNIYDIPSYSLYII